jgi:hypothetical protein
VDASLEGHFEKAGSVERVAVEGFCDSTDGSLFRIRFMPSQPGNYSYEVTFHQGDFSKSYSGTFKAVDAHRRGIVRVDPKYPWHFIWEGTGEHYFLNGTTAFLLMGFTDEKVIQASIIACAYCLPDDRARVSGASRLFLLTIFMFASTPG